MAQGQSQRLVIGRLLVDSPGLHVEVSLGKILNPKPLLMCWLAPCINQGMNICIALLLYLLWHNCLFWCHCGVPTLLYIWDSLTFVLHRCFVRLGNLVLEITFFLKQRASFIHTVVKFLIMTMVIYVAENLANRFQNSVVHSAWCLVKGCCHCWLLPVEYRLAWSICLSGPLPLIQDLSVPRV